MKNRIRDKSSTPIYNTNFTQQADAETNSYVIKISKKNMLRSLSS